MSEKIEKQAIMISKILFELAKSGIENRHLGIEDVDEAQENVHLFVDAGRWLQREGLISFDRVSGGRFFGCALQAKGFAILGMEIDLQGGKVTVREAAERVKSGKIDTTMAGDFIGALFGGFTKSISG